MKFARESSSRWYGGATKGVLFFSMAAMVAFSMGAGADAGAVLSRTYTLDADFDEGALVGVEHDTVHDQLQLSKETSTLPFIWVPNAQGTVSRIHTETGKELGRYRVAPSTLPSGGNPSRTTVDLQGNCWVGNRQAGTVVKIGLDEWIDRNDDSICQTSEDLNDDGDITGAELLAWGEDERVLYEVVLIEGKQGTYVPGTYAGGYDTNSSGTAPRGLAIDASNNLWAGTWSTKKYYYINGSTAAILKTVDVSSHLLGAYGAVIDKNGILWSSGGGGKGVLRIDVSADPPAVTKIIVPHTAYGMGLDYLDHLFVSGWTFSRLTRIDIASGTIQWTKAGPNQARGVVCTSDNDVWVASTIDSKVYRYDNNGVLKAGIPVGAGPTGVAIDAAGKIWSCDLNDNFVKRIDPATNAVDLSKDVVGSGGHYSYSDMTGVVSRTITTKIGTWTVVFDSQLPDMPWGKVSWTSDEPAGTSVSVRVRSSNDQAAWSGWEAAANGVGLTSTPDGQYLQIEATLQIVTGDVSPILYDLTVEVGNLPPVADAGDDQELEQTSYDGAEATLDGSGSTDDGLIEPLSYSWAWSGGSAAGVNPTAVFPLGARVVTLTVFDGQFSDEDTVVITVVDTTPPTVDAGPDVTVEQESFSGTEVELTGSAVDICDAELDVAWYEGAELLGTEETLVHTFNLGVHTVTFKATDDSGNVAEDTATVTVIDTIPPEVSCAVAVDSLWPPNHRMVDVGLTFSVSDICDAEPYVEVTVTSDEATATEAGAGGPIHSPDAVVTWNDDGTCTVELRSERSGVGDGRVYVITVAAVDDSGNEGSSSCTVVVDHDQGPDGGAVDSGQVYDATTLDGQTAASKVLDRTCLRFPLLEGDANEDCTVNIIDLIFIRNRLGLNVFTSGNWMADVNGDSKINILDLIFTRNRLNTRCPE